MKYRNIYEKKNLVLAWRKARRGKNKKEYVINFETKLGENIKLLYNELKNEKYLPRHLKTFILKDPKLRKISKSHFRDRIIHHAICNIIEPIFDKTFIYDSCANRKEKGTSLAIKRFNKYKRKITNNLSKEGFCLKCDIKKYFESVDIDILLRILSKKIKCNKTMDLILKILYNFSKEKGMPLGNLTSQFFANIYLNELDQFVKHKLKVKYYIRYVDDFVLLHSSREQLKEWKKEVEIFLKNKLKLELHPEKSKIINLSRGVDFVGFRNFYNYRLLRKRNIGNIRRKISLFNQGKIGKDKFKEIWQGWCAYANWANSYNLKKRIIKSIKAC